MSEVMNAKSYNERLNKALAVSANMTLREKTLGKFANEARDLQKQLANVERQKEKIESKLEVCISKIDNIDEYVKNLGKKTPKKETQAQQAQGAE